MNLLINPSSMVQMGYTPPPLGLLYIAAMDRDTVIRDMALYPDMPIEDEYRSWPIKVVGVPIYTVGRQESFRLLKMAHDHGAITVAGGPHVPLMFKMDWSPIEQYPFINHFVLDDGEVPWKEITQYSKKGDPVTIWKEDPKHPYELDSLPIPDYCKIKGDKYPARPSNVRSFNGIDLESVSRYSIVLGRGCSGSCNFCSTWWVHGKYRHHGEQWINAHIRALVDAGARHLCWQDDCLTADRGAFLSLCNTLGHYRLASIGTTRADCFDNDLAKAAHEAGFYEMSFGIESGSQRLLNFIHKDTNLEAAFVARDACRKNNIQFTALMMKGYPYETEDDKRTTREFLQRLSPDNIGTLGYTMVLPGTKLYQDCKRANLINDDFWLSDNGSYIYSGGLDVQSTDANI